MKLFTLRLKKQHIFVILLLCSSIVIGLALGAAVLQILLPKSYYIWTPHLEMVFKPYQDIMPGISGQSKFVANSIGIRGDELSPFDTYRILAIGGSTTECLYLDQAETWPYLLQKMLNETTPNHHVWVGNAGMSARNTRHHLTAMQYLPLREMKIDAVMLLIGINDFSVRLSQHENYNPNFLMKPKAIEKLVDKTFIGGKPFQYNQFFKKKAMRQMLKKVKRIVFQKNTQSNVQDTAGKIYVTWRQHRQQAAEIRNELPDLSSALEEYEKNINKIIDIAQANSIRLIFVTQPTIWHSSFPKELNALLWLGGIGNFQKESDKVYYSVDALEKGIEKYNHTLLRICQEREIECIDLSSMLEKDTTVFYDDVHFNESGARQVAKIISNYLLSHSPIKSMYH